MENDIPMLNSICRTTQMGCYGIKTVMNETVNRDFRNVLRAQLSEYEQIYTEADRLLREGTFPQSSPDGEIRLCPLGKGACACKS